MMEISIALIVLAILAVYGWGAYFVLRKKRKSLRIVTSPFTHKQKSSRIINEPQKEKNNEDNSGKF